MRERTGTCVCKIKMTKIHKSRSIFIKITIREATYSYMGGGSDTELKRDRRIERKSKEKERYMQE